MYLYFSLVSWGEATARSHWWSRWRAATLLLVLPVALLTCISLGFFKGFHSAVSNIFVYILIFASVAIASIVQGWLLKNGTQKYESTFKHLNKKEKVFWGLVTTALIIALWVAIIVSIFTVI